MGAVPTTEDLKYALAEAIRARKAVELPFKHPKNGIVSQYALLQVQI
jgi:hypothetical protein